MTMEDRCKALADAAHGIRFDSESLANMSRLRMAGGEITPSMRYLHSARQEIARAKEIIDGVSDVIEGNVRELA